MHLGELMTKAEHGMGFVCDDLRQAHADARPVAAIQLLELCEEANRLRARVAALGEAMESERQPKG